MMLKENKPRHEQISDWLRDKILSDTFSEGDQLPSESDLRSKFNVSRVTVRHALKTLENEGLIYRRQGLGSFVNKIELKQPVVCLTDFAEDMHRAGLSASSNVTNKEVVKANEDIAVKLDLEESTNVLRLDRVRLGNNRPVAFDITWMPMFYGQLLEGNDLEQDTIYEILEQQYEIPILEGHYKITAANADDYLARHLSVEAKQALLMIERVSMSTSRKKIYYQRRYYRPDRVNYEVQLERRDRSDCDYARGLPLKAFSPHFTTG